MRQKKALLRSALNSTMTEPASATGELVSTPTMTGNAFLRPTISVCPIGLSIIPMWQVLSASDQQSNVNIVVKIMHAVNRVPCCQIVVWIPIPSMKGSLHESPHMEEFLDVKALIEWLLQQPACFVLLNHQIGAVEGLHMILISQLVSKP